MRKRLITPTPETIRARGEGWLDIERSAGPDDWIRRRNVRRGSELSHVPGNKVA
jgi:hypothetical protein